MLCFVICGINRWSHGVVRRFVLYRGGQKDIKQNKNGFIVFSILLYSKSKSLVQIQMCACEREREINGSKRKAT
jgi:hypothetical protein